MFQGHSHTAHLEDFLGLRHWLGKLWIADICLFFFFLINFYNVGLVSTVQQGESVIHIHIFSFWISFPFRSPESTEFPELCSYVLITDLFYT